MSIAAMLKCARPRFLEMHLFFTNVLLDEHLEALAQADHMELVRQVHEFYLDFWAPAEHVFHANLSSVHVREHGLDSYCDRNAAVLFAALQALNARVHAVRYWSESAAASKVAHSLAQQVHAAADKVLSRAVNSSRTCTASVLILDRREDPVTPLLSQWTYQAMLHELLGLDQNRVRVVDTMSGAEKAAGAEDKVRTPEQATLVVSDRDDVFFRASARCFWGDLLSRAQQRMDELRAEEQSVKQSVHSGTLADMERLLDRIPEYRARKANVAKHVDLLTALQKQVARHGLAAMGLLEQELVAPATHLADHQSLFDRVYARFRRVDGLYG